MNGRHLPAEPADVPRRPQRAARGLESASFPAREADARTRFPVRPRPARRARSRPPYARRLVPRSGAAAPTPARESGVLPAARARAKPEGSGSPRRAPPRPTPPRALPANPSVSQSEEGKPYGLRVHSVPTRLKAERDMSDHLDQGCIGNLEFLVVTSKEQKETEPGDDVRKRRARPLILSRGSKSRSLFFQGEIFTVKLESFPTSY
uniref:uncharacterized protein LOC118539674 n=1 Tax=Halichoerus grypus TaxID=9711 RepID=UPI0016599893|nr:uncharacterized protein LOC118539674 [Halichoerus grypus]